MLTVIIPTQNDERALVPTLASLVSGAASGVVREVVVADGGSRDDTAVVADIAGCHLLQSTAPLASRLRQAVAKARAPWLMFIEPGAVLDAGWSEEVARFAEHCERTGLAQTRAGLFRDDSLARIDRSLIAEAAALVRKALRLRPEQGPALVISRRFYDALGCHGETAQDPHHDLVARIGRARLITFRNGAAKITPIMPVGMVPQT